MLCELVHTFEQHDIAIVICKGEPYFRANVLTRILEYKNSAKAIRMHVSAKYTKTLQELHEEASSATQTNVLNWEHSQANVPSWEHFQKRPGKSPLYLSESGVYELVFQSVKPEAVRFREWLVEEVLPEIRKTGKYVRQEQVSLMNETDLHYKVIDFVRKHFSEAILIAGLGELQDTDAKRISAKRKGYTKGQPDILILNRTHKRTGLAIELKTPLGCGTTSLEQEAFLNTLRKQKYETVLSHCYDEIIVKIIEYREAARRCTSRG